MRVDPANNKTIMEAIKAQNSGNHNKAASLFQQAGNQYRNPDEKQMLWDAAKKSRSIANSD